MTLDDVDRSSTAALRKRRSSGRLLTPFVQTSIVGITAVLVIGPLLPILYQSFIAEPLYQGELTATLGNYARLFTSRTFYDVICLTLAFSLGMSILSTLTGAVMALLTVRPDITRGRGTGWLSTHSIYHAQPVPDFLRVTG